MGRSVRAAAAVLADAAASGRCTAARAAKLSDRIQWPMGIGHSCCMNRIHVTRMGPRPPQSFTVIQRSTALYSIQLYIASPIHYTPSTTPSNIGRHLSPQTTAAPRPPLSPPPPAILRRRLLAYSAAASSSAGSSAARLRRRLRRRRRPHVGTHGSTYDQLPTIVGGGRRVSLHHAEPG